jgi:NAD(P)-dependent dehydrogenase (short-subunit alcohol dehydrogenase family)
MVRTGTVQTANRALASADDASGLVCVFVGATSGIGLSTVTALLSITRHSTFYIVGRSEKGFAPQMRCWGAMNKSCRLVFLEAQVSLLSEVDVACAKVTEAEERVDVLYMSPGYLPVGPRQCK